MMKLKYWASCDACDQGTGCWLALGFSFSSDHGLRSPTPAPLAAGAGAMTAIIPTAVSMAMPANTVRARQRRPNKPVFAMCPSPICPPGTFASEFTPENSIEAGLAAQVKRQVPVVLSTPTWSRNVCAVGGQIGPRVARLGVGQGLLVPVRVARSGEAEHRPLPRRCPLDDLEPFWARRALGPGDSPGPPWSPQVVVGEERKTGRPFARHARPTMKYVGPKREQRSCGTCYRDLLVREHAHGEVVRDVVMPRHRPQRDALPDRQWNDLGRAILLAHI